LHSPHFDMDERVLDVGVRLFEHALVRFLEKGDSEV
jgi:metal-dependent amidase/aminoacylase/carboxypeptidase family protein